ncbi:hypothetical protein D3C85_703320 [compost metagenome]
MSLNGIGLPKGSIWTFNRVLSVWSSRVTWPLSKPMAPMSSTQFDGSAFSSLGARSKVQLARPSARRCRSALGSVRSIRGISTCCSSKGKGARRNSTRLSVAICLSLAQSGLPNDRSSATKRGQGTQARQPPWSGSRRHNTARLPLIANGRCSASEILSLRVGLIRFQSNVAMMNTATASNKRRLENSETRAFVVRFMHVTPEHAGHKNSASEKSGYFTETDEWRAGLLSLEITAGK